MNSSNRKFKSFIKNLAAVRIFLFTNKYTSRERNLPMFLLNFPRCSINRKSQRSFERFVVRSKFIIRDAMNFPSNLTLSNLIDFN